MFGILRIFIGIVLGVIANLFVLKFVKIQLQRMFRVIIAVSVILLITVIGFVPFENLVYNFKSAEEVYEYYHFSEGSVELVVEGEQSDFVVGRKNGASIFSIVPKTEDGWKIGISLNTKRIAQKFFDGIIVGVYQYKNTNDYFISVFDTAGRITEITDAYNTEFYPLEDSRDFLGKKFVAYYAHVSDFNPQYSAVVNGTKIVFNQGTDI